MSEDEESRTEQSAKRMREAWSEGQIPLGHDAPLVVSLAAGAASLVLLGGSLRTAFVHLMEEALGALAGTPFRILPGLSVLPVAAVAAICVAAVAGSVLVTLVQTKGTFWPERWVPDLSRLFDPSPLPHMFIKPTF